MNDWKGCHSCAKVQNGVSTDKTHKRDKDDFYATDPIALWRLAQKFEIPKNIWEPCCGLGHLSKWLLGEGHNVYSSDLINRGFGVGGIDFFTTDKLRGKGRTTEDYAILTNPPFRYIEQFILHSLDLLNDGQKLIVFAKTTFIEGVGRYEKIFKNTPPDAMYQFTKRVLCGMNGNFDYASSAVSYAWYVWIKGRYEQTKLIWI